MSSGNVTIFVRSPVGLFLLPGLFCLLIWLFSPIDFVYSGDGITVVLTLCLPLMFSVGLLMGFRRVRSSVVHLNLKTETLRRIVVILSLLGFSGLILRLIERIYLRANGAITTDFMANRVLMETGGNGLLALLGGVLSAFLLLLPFYVMLLNRLGERRWRYFNLMLLSAIYPLADIFLQGSRSTLVIYSGACFISIVTMNRFRLRVRYIVILLLVLVGMGWGAGKLFVLRTEQMGMDPVASMYTSGYAYFAPASDEVIYYLYEGGLDGFYGFIYAYVHICQYLLHGFYELIYIVENIHEPTTYGLQSFYIPGKIIFSLANGVTVEEILSNQVLRPGVFTTLFGPWVYDFGLYGCMLASVMFGFGAGSLARILRRGNSVILPLYIVVFGFLPFSFVVNLFVSGTGQYSLLGASFLSLFLCSKSYKGSRTNRNLV